ncbi:hypothetical protein BH20CHL6_BH20CHL6_00730 [soil metagenome]
MADGRYTLGQYASSSSPGSSPRGLVSARQPGRSGRPAAAEARKRGPDDGGTEGPESSTARSAASPATSATNQDHFRHGYTKDRAQLLRRLSRLEGQVRGVSRMIEREDYCIDILQQTAALRAAVDSVSLMVLEDHVAGCLRTAVETGDAAAYTDEVMDVVRRSLGRPVRGGRSVAE